MKIHIQYWGRLCRLEGLTGLDEIDFQRHVVYDRTTKGASRHIKMIVRLGFFLTSRTIPEEWALLHDHFHQACDSHELYKLVLPCISRSRCSDMTTLMVAHIPWFFCCCWSKKHTHKVHLLVFLLTLLLNGKHTQNKERINYTFSKYLMDAAAQVEKRENWEN